MDIDVALVRALIAAQFPQWAHLPVRPVGRSGWDNRTFRLGDELSVRLPSAEGYVPAVEKEQRWLPYLAPRLPVPIPVPAGRGVPGAGYPYPWSVYRWIEGTPVHAGPVFDLLGFATDLAGFLVALRAVDPAGGPAAAVIDFGTCGIGDPASDLRIAWTLFDGESRAAFRDAVDQDEATWARATGWTLWKALITAYDPGSRRVLAELLRT
jgi:aminoglycoside phosphotransferase (APT) family kinase protein